LVLRCFKQVSKLFQPFIIGFKQLPNPFQHFAIRFQLFNIFQHCFSSVFQIYFIVVGSDQFQKAFFVQKCNSGAGSDQLLFLDDIL